MACTDFDDLEEIPTAATKEQAEKAVHPYKYQCDHCSGTGRWLDGRSNRYGNSKCNACGGRGFYLNSAADRQKKRTARVESKARRLEDGKAAFEETYPGLIETLRGMTSWNDFATSLLNGFEEYGSLTEKQIAAAQRMVAKVAATRATKTAEREANTVTVDLTPIRTMFESAVAAGHKKPMYRAEGIVINRAPDHGKNPGCIYVKSEGNEYLGKITAENVFRPTHSAGKETTEALHRISSDPKAAAVKYGQRTGSCSCCGRELTKTESIEL